MVKFYYICLIILISFITAFAKPTLLSPKHQNSTASIEYSIDSYSIDTVLIDGKKYIDISIEGLPAFLLEKGKPQLPIDAIAVKLFGNEKVQIVIDSIEYESFQSLPPIPSKGNFTRNLKPSLIKLLKGDIYKKNEWYPKSNIISSTPFQIRGVSGISLQVAPVQYNGKKGELKIATKITFSVIEDNPGNSRAFNHVKSRAFSKILKDRFINYNEFESRAANVEDGDKMIIITPQKYRAALNEFVTWKNQKGISTTVYLYPDETGADTNEVKAFIKSKYENDGISYVTLIGDGEDIPAYMVPVDDKDYGSRFDSIVPADPIYAMVSGDDLYPDLFIGRVPGNSESEVTVILDKIINYEKSPDPSGSWYQKAVGIGSDEGSPADYDWIRDSIHSGLTQYGFTQLDEIFQGDGKTENDFSSYINEGRSLVNFMGHGYFDGFGFNGPFWYSTTYIEDLSNGSKLPVVIPLACNFGQYLGREGAAEYWIKNPDGGAVAVTGSTPLMDWTPPQWAQVEMNKLITEEAHNSFGAYFYNGEMKMLDISVYQGEKTVKTWVYFGDPSLQLFTKTPTAMNFSFSDYRDGSLSISGENEALVTICNESMEIIESKIVASGRADFSFTASNGDTITITATKRNRVPFIQTYVIGESNDITEIFTKNSSFQILKVTPETLTLNVSQKGNYSVEILSLNGRLISRKESTFHKGIQTVELKDNRLSQGLVLLKVKGAGIKFTEKILIR